MPTPYPGAIVPAVPYPMPVPLPVLGTGLVTVSFDQAWLPYIIGVCKVFVAEATWDPPTTTDVDNTIKAAYDLLTALSQAQFIGFPPPPTLFSGFLGDDMPELRQNPSNPCQAQVQCADGSWTTFFDASLCFGNPAPGAGVVPPVGGQCASFSFSADSRVLTPLPMVVNAGDTIQATSLLGASTDGSGHWYCPDGEIFLLGACAGGGSTSSGDPLNTTNHQALLLKIGSNYYPLTMSLFTVPSGVVNQPVYVQTNDASLTNNVGTYHVALTVCNNQSAPATAWCETLDLTVSPHGFTASTGIDGNGQPYGPAVWVSGQGWENHPQQPPPSTTQEYYCALFLDLGATYTFDYAAAGGHVGNASGGTLPEEVRIFLSTSPALGTGTQLLNATGVGRNADYSVNNSPSPVSGRYLWVFSIGYSFTGADDPIFIVKNLTFKGTGTNPFGASNCV